MLTLRYTGTTTVPVEAECITPDHLADKTSAEIARLPLQHGNAQVPLGDFFDIEGNAEDGEIVIEGDCSRVKWVGAEMTAGRITIRGDAGMHLGAEMKGGEIRVHGNVGDWAGAEMKGGHVHIHGNAGHLAGAAYRGGEVGMRGGTLLIDGNAGHEVGTAMRRGLIAVGGTCGDYPGVGMIAGSLFLFGAVGLRAGAGMKRGTIVAAGDRPALLPTFRPQGFSRPVFLSVYLRQLRQWGFTVVEELFAARWHRAGGDLVSLGKGEIFTRRP
jgi:formylmethanofuran dehydrogenase subunit C